MNDTTTDMYRCDSERVHRAGCDRLTGLAPYATVRDLTTKSGAPCCRPTTLGIAQTVERMVRAEYAPAVQTGPCPSRRSTRSTPC